MTSTDLFSERGTPQIWRLIGFGDKSQNCSKPLPILSCQSCLKVHWIKHRCQLSSCPECWEIWHKKATAKIKTRLCSDKAKAKNGKYKKIKHIVLSPSGDLIKSNNYWELRQLAIDFLYDSTSMYAFRKKDGEFLKLTDLGFEPKGRGFTIPRKAWLELGFEQQETIKAHYKVITSAPSGVLIWHPYRLTKEAMIEFRESNRQREPQDQEKKWEWLRRQPNWRTWVRYSPHFHFIGFVGWLEKQQKKQDFIYKTIQEVTPEGKKVSILQDTDVYRAVSYLLTHTATLEDKPYLHPYVYTGNISDRNGRSKQEQELDENGFYENGDNIYIRNSTKEERKIKKANCKWCQKHGTTGRLWYSHQNLMGFLTAYAIHVPPGFDKWRDLIPLVKKLDTPSYMILHVLEYLMIRMGKPPPVNQDYLVE